MSKIFIALALILTLSACTDSSDRVAVEEASRKRQERERQEQEEAARQPAAPELEEVEEAAPEEIEPQVPDEPEKVLQYRLREYGRGLNPGVNCLCREKSECGMTFYACDNGMVYACIHEVVYTVGLTLKTENNANACEYN